MNMIHYIVTLKTDFSKPGCLWEDVFAENAEQAAKMYVQVSRAIKEGHSSYICLVREFDYAGECAIEEFTVDIECKISLKKVK